MKVIIYTHEKNQGEEIDVTRKLPSIPMVRNQIVYQERVFEIDGDAVFDIDQDKLLIPVKELC